MAEIHHIVGAVLRDVARARVTSDVYSRDISRFYESDALLRRFPVPRSEIDEVELDLRFVIGGVEDDESSSAENEASLATVFAKVSVDLAHELFGLLLSAYEGASSPESTIDESWQELRRLLGNTSRRIYLQVDLLNYLSRNQGHLVSNGALDEDKASVGLERIFGATVSDLLAAAGIEAPDGESLTKVPAPRDLRRMVARLANAVDGAFEAAGGRRVDVDVTADVLRETPESAISTLKIKAFVKNYMWSEVNEVDGRVWRRLSPE